MVSTGLGGHPPSKRAVSRLDVLDSSRCYIHVFGAAMAIAMAIDPIDIFLVVACPGALARHVAGVLHRLPVVFGSSIEHALVIALVAVCERAKAKHTLTSILGIHVYLI